MDQTRVLIINPNASAGSILDTTSLGVYPILNPNKFYNGALGVNGRIYFSSLNYNDFEEIDPYNNTKTGIFASLLSTLKWSGGALYIDGKIYFAPYNEPRIAIINTKVTPGVLDTSSITFSPSGGNFKWRNAVLAPNGKIYCCPDNETRVLIINPETGIADTTTITITNAEWSKFVLGHNGKIYAIPLTNSLIGMIRTGIPKIDMDFCLSDFQNN